MKKSILLCCDIFLFKMKYISFNVILIAIFLGYMLNIVKNFAEIFIPPTCESGDKCFKPYVLSHPVQNLYVYSSHKIQPNLNDVKNVLFLRGFDYKSPSERSIDLLIPHQTRNNGSMFLHIAIAQSGEKRWTWNELQSKASIERIPLIVFTPPQAATFNLLKSKTQEDSPRTINKNVKSVAHLKSQISFSMLTDPIFFPANAIPGELYNYLRLTHDGEYLPIVQYDFLKSRLEDLVEIKKDTLSLNISLNYAPSSIGKMKLLVHISMALKSLSNMGFNEKNIDEVKSIFADTNLYLLCATVIISSFHLLFDFLAFKNDISFWREKKSMAGLSARTVLWRAFSQTVILLYLLDENTSMLILVPTAIGTLIELWKVKKMFHINISWTNRFPRIVFATDSVNKAELQTRAVDAEAMKYLTYILYPICTGGAVYSLVYLPHKSWYSWTLHSVVNGVYAFGFLFMLPQLFINYKLKSVAALPWRAFMYKAFNTFIDDVFAFIITMPVAHRVACFRDDVVFIIYLYQRWLYPVDKSRVDDSTSIEETVNEAHEKND